MAIWQHYNKCSLVTAERHEVQLIWTPMSSSKCSTKKHPVHTGLPLWILCCALTALHAIPNEQDWSIKYANIMVHQQCPCGPARCWADLDPV